VEQIEFFEEVNDSTGEARLQNEFLRRVPRNTPEGLERVAFPWYCNGKVLVEEAVLANEFPGT
jgi:hypothetical protein